MKKVKRFLLVIIILAYNSIELHADPLRLRVEHSALSPSKLTLRWSYDSESTPILKAIELQKSTDLHSWSILYRSNATEAKSDPVFEGFIEDDIDEKIAFYRILSGTQVLGTASVGEDIMGFTDRFEQALADYGEIDIPTFRQIFTPELPYSQPNPINISDVEFYPSFQAGGFAMNATEESLLKKHGFVASGRLGSASFTDIYYQHFMNHLPVYVSLDSVLDAWHRTYSTILAELEEGLLAPRLAELLQAMHKELAGLATQLTAESDTLHQSLSDVDYYLSVAQSLLNGAAGDGTTVFFGLTPEPPGVKVAKILPPVWDASISDKVRITLDQIVQSKLADNFQLFGRMNGSELVDFSQFKVRGHYTKSPILYRYFLTFMWLGRVDFRVAGPPELASSRELGAAMILNDLLDRAGKTQVWHDMNSILRLFVGTSDSMDFPQLTSLLKVNGIQSTQDIINETQLQNIQSQIESGQLGIQEIYSHGIFNDHVGDAKTMIFPRSFAFFGQRFVMDSWALGMTVHDKILKDGMEVWRRLPSGLDVAFSVFGNQHVTSLLADRIQNKNGIPWRDGYPYQHQLAALKKVFDEIPKHGWEDNLYNRWLGSIRKLSTSSLAGHLPIVFQSELWAMRLLNTQMASWTQLRHDTTLYAKQSGTPPVTCDFPFSYISPYPEVWRSLGEMAEFAGGKIAPLGKDGMATFRANLNTSNPYETNIETFQTPIQAMLNDQITHLKRFASTCYTLSELADKELKQIPFTSEETSFLKDMVEIKEFYTSWTRSYNGWFPQLYYHGIRDRKSLDGDTPHPSDLWDPVVVDVHTDYPCDCGDPGTILHEGVGNPHFMLVAIECDGVKRAYGSGIFSYYEFTSEQGVFDRKTDEEWKEQLRNKPLDSWPALPEWTRSYMVPGKITIPEWALPH